MPSPTPTPATSPDLAAWDAVLGGLEADLDEYEALLDSPDGPPADVSPEWAEPTGLGPLPTELLPRAHAITGRQQQLRVKLVEALADNTRQRDFTSRVTDATTTRPTPAYLDVTA